jgi:hypothetical protein
MTRHGWFELFLFLHVTGAVTALGPSLTYSLWRRREAAAPETRAFVLRGISWIDRRVATPSFAMQAVTGAALVVTLRISVLHTPRWSGAFARPPNWRRLTRPRSANAPTGTLRGGPGGTARSRS